MKRTLLIALVAALVSPLALHAQEQQLTVADGTTSSYALPMYMSYVDDGFWTEMIYPESMLGDMANGTITKLTFYTTPSYANQTWDAGTIINIYMGSSSVDTYSAYSSGQWVGEDMSLAYSGEVASQGGLMVIDLDEPYTYDGGNLCIRVTNTGGVEYHTCYFYGTSTSGYYGVYKTSTHSTTPSAYSIAQSFLAKCTFGYEVGYGNSCLRPANPAVDDVTAGGCTFSWTPRGDETSWIVYADGEQLDVTTDTFYTFTTLSSSTAHSVGVRAFCAEGDTSVMLSASFTTACVEISEYPMDEGFETMTAASISSCWGRYYYFEESYGWFSPDIVSNTTSWPKVATTMAHTGSQALQMACRNDYDWDDDYEYDDYAYSAAFMPLFDDSLQNLTVSFWYRVPSYYAKVSLAVGVSTADGDTTNFTRLKTILPEDGDWHEYDLDLSAYTGTGRLITFVQVPYGAESYYTSLVYGYIDDIQVDHTAQCVRPSSVYVTALGDTSVSVAWVADDENGTYRVSLNGDTANAVIVNGQLSATLSVEPNTEYVVGVSKLCGGEYTTPRNYTFTTPCSAIPDSELPWFEDFNSVSQVGYSSTNFLTIPCMSFIYYDDGYAIYPYAESSTHYGASGNSLYLSQGSYSTPRQTVVLPAFESPLSGLSLSFQAYAGSNSYRLEVGVMTDPAVASTFVPVDTIAPDATSTWEYKEVFFGGYSGGGQFIAIRPLAGVGTYYYIDNLSVAPASSCRRVQGVSVSVASATSATISIADSNEQNSYRLVFASATDTFSVDVTSAQHTIDTLQPGTRYALSVYTVCDGVLTSPNTASFTTPCYPLTHADLPYTEDFDSYTPGTGSDIDPCWHAMSFYSTGYPYPTSGTRHDSVGNSLYFYAGSYTQHCYAVMPALDNLSDLLLDFWLYGYYSQVRMDVGVMTDPNDTATFALIASFTSANSTWTQCSTDFASYTGSGKYIAFRLVSSSSYGYGMYLDDVSLTTLSECVSEIVSTSVSGISSTGATIGWQRGVGLSESVNVVVSSTSSVDVTIIANAENPCVISGLDAETEYEVRIDILCGGEVTATATTSFTTLCPSSAQAEVSSATTGLSAATSNSYVPFNPRYTNSASEQVYTAVEIGTSGSIVALSFNYIPIAPTTHFANSRIYMAHVADSALSAWVQTDDMELVYEGSLDMTATGWNNFTLTTPFDYNGTDNLLMAVVVDGTYYEDNQTLYFAANTAWSNVSRYYNNDNTPFSGTQNTTGTDKRADVRFTVCGASNLGCDTPSVPVLAEPTVGTNSVTLSWTGDADLYEAAIVAGTTWSEPETILALGYTTCAFNQLAADTDYVVGVRAVCDEAHVSQWATRAIHTAAEPSGIAGTDALAVSLYPNPASGSVTIEADAEALVELLDLNGRPLLISSCAAARQAVSLAGVPQGTYFVRITTAAGTAVRKLIVR